MYVSESRTTPMLRSVAKMLPDAVAESVYWHRHVCQFAVSCVRVQRLSSDEMEFVTKIHRHFPILVKIRQK